MFEWTLSVFCFHNQNRYFNGLKTCFLKLYSKVGGFLWWLIFYKKQSKCIFLTELWPKSTKIDKLRSKLWPKSVKKLFWPTLFDRFRSQFFSPHTSLRDYGCFFLPNSRSKHLILTEILTEKTSYFGRICTFWSKLIGQKNVRRNFIVTDRSKTCDRNFDRLTIGQNYDLTEILTESRSKNGLTDILTENFGQN